MTYKGILSGKLVTLRTIELSDCTEEYLSWLNDPMVNKYLETRLSTQTHQSIYDFVHEMIRSDSSYLFAMISNDSRIKHIGNIKLGPVHPFYLYADVSYFIGDKDYWGKGIATEAIKQVVDLAFNKFILHRVQAGVFEHNIGSIKALENSGFILEGRRQKQLRVYSPKDRNEHDESDIQWQDHLFYGMINDNESL